MKSLDELYKELEEHKDFDVPGNIDKFLEAVDAVVLRQIPESILFLLKYFVYDDREYSWVYEELSCSIFRLIETTPKAFLLLMSSIDWLLEQSPEWLSNILCVLLNSSKNVNFFKKNINIINPKVLKDLLNLLEDEYPHHKDLIAELRKELD